MAINRLRVLFLSSLLTPCILSAQESTDTRDVRRVTIENPHIVVETEHIQLSFLVRDEQGQFIKDLTSEDFVLMENGQERQIVALQRQEVPISVVLAVDTSASMGSKMGNAVNTALDFFNGLAGESVSLVSFSETPEVLLNWNSENRDAAHSLQGVEAERKTALYDSIIWISEHLFSERQGKKLIVLLSDCIDTLSTNSFKEMMSSTRAAGIVLYPIIHTNPSIQGFRKKKAIAQRLRRPVRGISADFQNFIAMQDEFLDQSMRYGGRTIFSDSFSDLGRIYQDIIQEMKSHYVMLYQSDTNDDTSERNLRVHTRRIPGKIFIDIGL